MASKAKQQVAEAKIQGNLDDHLAGISSAWMEWQSLHKQAAAMRTMTLWTGDDQARHDDLLQQMEPHERRIMAYGTHRNTLDVAKIKARLVLAKSEAKLALGPYDAALLARAVMQVR